MPMSVSEYHDAIRQTQCRSPQHFGLASSQDTFLGLGQDLGSWSRHWWYSSLRVSHEYVFESDQFTNFKPINRTNWNTNNDIRLFLLTYL